MPSPRDRKIAKTHDSEEFNIADTDVTHLVEFTDLEGLFDEEGRLSDDIESQD